MKTNFKKLVLALGVCTALTFGASAFATEFTDMPEGEVGVAMQAAVDNGLLNGMGDNKIGPDENITRSQMGAILVRAFGASKKADISAFSDMNPAAWYYEEMSKAVAMGAFKGDGANLNPEQNITFQEAFVVLSRIFDLADRKTDDTSDPLAKLNDGATVAPWAAADVALMLKFGYWTPVDGNLRPTEYITRAEFAVVMHNLVKTYIDEDDIKGQESAVIQVVNEDKTLSDKEITINYVSEFAEGNVIVRVSDVKIKDFDQSTHDIYLSDNVTGEIFFENCNAHRVVSRSTECIINVPSSAFGEVRMFPRETDDIIDCYLGKDSAVKAFDGAGCNVFLPPHEM